MFIKHGFFTGAFLVLCIFSAGAIAASPIEDFAKAPVISGPQLSPDGHYFAAMTVKRGKRKLGIWTIGADGIQGPEIYNFNGDAIRHYKWAGPDKLTVSVGYFRVSGLNGILQSVLFIVDAGTGQKKIAYDFGGRGRKIQYRDEIVQRLPADPDHILVALDLDRPGFPGLHKYHLATGALEKVSGAMPPVSIWVAGADGIARIGISYHGAVKEVLVRQDASAPWQSIGHFDLFGPVRFEPLVFDPDRPEILYVLSNRDGDKVGLHEYDIVSKTYGKTLYIHEKYDVDGAILSPRDQRLLGILYHENYPVSVYFDPQYQAIQERINNHLPESENNIISISDDENLLIVHAESQKVAAHYYLYDVAKNNMRRVGAAYPALDGQVLAAAISVSYPARDGTEIPAYLTLPRDMQKGKKPAMIVLPHGGPVARDDAHYDYLVQFLASRGYGILQPNFRGSSGYGLDFERAGYREWGGLIQDDIVDGARWLIAEGIADADRMCIVGVSFGGYSALMASIKAPDLFRCAVSLNGSSNLIQRKAELRAYRFNGTFLPRITGALGDATLKGMSPYFRAEEINIPVLLVHGTKDTSVPFQHTRRMAKKLLKLDKKVTYLPIKGGNHSMTNERYRLRFLKALESFLSDHLPQR